MTSCGTTHSCKLRPPWLYSLPAMKQSMPGGQAIRTSSDQNHEKQGVRPSPSASPPHTAASGSPSGTWAGRAFGRPFGHQQPAVVGDDPDLLPAGLQQRLDALHQAGQQFRDAAGQAAPFVVAGLVEVAELGPRLAGRDRPVSVGEVLDAVVGQQLAEPVRRQVLAVLGDAGPELFARRPSL